jgi:hypothetical protein
VAAASEVLEGIEDGAEMAAMLRAAPVVRRWYNQWGATPAETVGAMPGDELVPFPKLTSTRAASIDAPPPEVWAWLVQIGQGRGGFYSIDRLENPAALRHSQRRPDQARAAAVARG